MRKILAAFLLIAVAATSSFAAATATSKGDKTLTGKTISPYNAASEPGAAVGKMSTGVYVAWATLTTSYIIKTQHLSGLKIFATASDSTAINWKPTLNNVKGADITVPDALATNTALINEGGWSVM